MELFQPHRMGFFIISLFDTKKRVEYVDWMKNVKDVLRNDWCIFGAMKHKERRGKLYKKYIYSTHNDSIIFWFFYTVFLPGIVRNWVKSLEYILLIKNKKNLNLRMKVRMKKTPTIPRWFQSNERIYRWVNDFLRKHNMKYAE